MLKIKTNKIKARENSKEQSKCQTNCAHTRTAHTHARWQVSRIKFNWIWVFTSGTSRRAKPQAAPPSCSSSFVWLLPMRPTFLHCVCVCASVCVRVCKCWQQSFIHIRSSMRLKPDFMDSLTRQARPVQAAGERRAKQSKYCVYAKAAQTCRCRWERCHAEVTN